MSRILLERPISTDDSSEATYTIVVDPETFDCKISARFAAGPTALAATVAFVAECAKRSGDRAAFLAAVVERVKQLTKEEAT